MTLSDRMVVMRDGRVAQAARPRGVPAPADTFVAAFVGSPKMNFLDGTSSGRGVHVQAAGFTIAWQASRRRRHARNAAGGCPRRGPSSDGRGVGELSSFLDRARS